MQNTENKGQERASPSLKGDILLLMAKIVFAAVFLLIVFTMIFGIEVQEDDSMKPAVREGDMVLYYRMNKNYRARDLVMVKEGQKKYVRRVIAVESDEVGMNENGILINGYGQQEDEVYTETEAITDGIQYPVKLSAGQIFVMGDNRPVSRDSRTYGPVDVKSATAGKVLLVIRRRHL